MTKFIRFSAASVLSALLIGGSAISPAYAQDETRQFSEAAGKVVNSTMILADSKNYEAALAELRTLISKPDLNAYERATLYKMIGQYSYELDRIEDSQRAFENAIESGGLLGDDVDNLNIVIAQLMIANGQYFEGAERLEKYLASGGEEKSQYVDLLVNARVQSEDYAGALPWAETWFEAADPKARKHYDLMNFLYSQLGMKEDQMDLLKEMIDLWPEDKNLWDSWSSILANAGREAEAFEVDRMMYQAGLLTDEKELLTLIQYYAFYDLPYQAAETLKVEMEAKRIATTENNLKQAALYYRQAREPELAIPFLEAAAKLSNDSDLNSDLGQTFSLAGECKKSNAAFQIAIDQGYDKGKASMLLGNCFFNQSEKLDRLKCNMSDAQIKAAPKSVSREAALNAFRAVPKTSREKVNAQKWVQFIEADIQAYDRRCEFSHHRGHEVTDQLCYQKIKQAYDAAIFTDEFKLDDETCEKFVSDYNAEFRVRYLKD